MYTIRKLRLRNLHQLHLMYEHLSGKSKYFFNPGFLGFKTMDFRWVLAQVALATSAFEPFRKLLLYIYPSSVFLSVIATNELNEIVGFGYIKVKRRISKKNFLGELGICVRDDYQLKGVGSRLMKELMELARKENMRKIRLMVLLDNVNAIHLYQKHGFRRTRIIKDNRVWHGKRLECMEMFLNLS